MAKRTEGTNIFFSIALVNNVHVCEINVNLLCFHIILNVYLSIVLGIILRTVVSIVISSVFRTVLSIVVILLQRKVYFIFWK